jgi:hypothetical protein
MWNDKYYDWEWDGDYFDWIRNESNNLIKISIPKINPILYPIF